MQHTEPAYKKVEVVWVDAVNTDIVEFDEPLPYPPYERTIGYLIGEERGAIHVAQHIDEEVFRNVCTIPREYIRYMSFLVYKRDAMAEAEIDYDKVSNWKDNFMTEVEPCLGS